MIKKIKFAVNNIALKTLSLVVVIILFVFSCFYNYYTRSVVEPKQILELEDAITEQVAIYRDGKAEIIDLSQVNTVEWDTLYIFPPEKPISDIRKKIGVKWFFPVGYYMFDGDATGMMFMDNDKVAQYVFYPRGYNDFFYAAGKYERSKARFIVEKFNVDGHGYIKPCCPTCLHAC